MKNIDSKKIRNAFFELSKKSEMEKNRFLLLLSKILNENKRKIIKANSKDLNKAKNNHLSDAFIQRLKLDEIGIKHIIDKILRLQNLKSGLGEITEQKFKTNGLILQKIRVAIGAILVIYEARPEVTIDVACLCIKSGNVAILKGGSAALQTNKILYKCILKALRIAIFSRETVSLIDSMNRQIIDHLLKQSGFIDLVIARGSYEMVKKIQENSSIPVLAHSSGGARIYIDKSANASIVNKIIINAKTTKPSACNSLDTILIHKDIKDLLCASLTKSLKKNQVKIVDNVWNKEFLSLKLSIKIVDSIDEAIDFINTYGKKHSEGIIAEDKNVIQKFAQSIDAAAVFVNCSTRFHDGYEFGLGSEMGIATGKLHARGPVGLKELTIYKWIAYGKGHVRS